MVLLDRPSREGSERARRHEELPTASSGPWLVALVALVGVGALVRVWGLGSTRLGYDEAFTAMAGRMPLGSLFAYLRTHDSHPPLDYLVHLPLARLGAGEFAYRLPSVACSITALALFAWWMRTQGRRGVLATAVFALSAFLVLHGRTARGYAELELIGVAVVVLADAWLRRPRRAHAWLLGGLVFAGLLTHVSMFLLGAGLLVLAGTRRDRDAWRWRLAVVGGGLGWAALWGSSFLVQSQGGHSDWIPRTTPARLVDTLSSLTTNTTVLALPVAVAIVGGGVLLVRRDPRSARLWWSLFGVTVGLVAVGGFVVPLLLDRTLTLVAWGPALALGVVVDCVWTRSRVAGVGAVIVLLALLVPATFSVLTDRAGVTTGLDRLAAISRPGDVVAVHSAGKLPELEWTLGVRSGRAWRVVTVAGVPRVGAVLVGDAPPTGRVWVLDWNRNLPAAHGFASCAPDWNFGRSRIVCLQRTATHTVSVTPHP